MAEEPGTQTITSSSDQQKSVPIVTVETFYNSHAEKLQMKLEGPRVGFHRKIREPTINRPGLALSGFYTYFAEKRVDILGVGVLIRGVSGIGKSECVLGLIERGYSLVADDVTRITMLEGRELMATAPEMTRNHMEVRGIGIIDVAKVFGIGSIRVEK